MARLFSVLWILVGISMIGILTSVLNNSLTSAITVPEKVINQAKVSVNSHVREQRLYNVDTGLDNVVWTLN